MSNRHIGWVLPSACVLASKPRSRSCRVMWRQLSVIEIFSEMAENVKAVRGVLVAKFLNFKM